MRHYNIIIINQFAVMNAVCKYIDYFKCMTNKHNNNSQMCSTLILSSFNRNTNIERIYFESIFVIFVFL